MAFRIDLEGRLAKIRLGAANSLQALFEAVANAAEAVESNGRVTVRVLRDEASPVMQTRTEAVGRHNLVGFEVVDNGVGFDPANYESFIHSDSRHKSARGGKGIGRLLWLKVFKKAEIDSVYRTPAGLRRRRFRFSLGDQGVGEDQSDQALPEGDAGRGTTVRLVDPLPGREGHLDMDAERLSGRLVEYFFLYFSVFPGVGFDLVDDAAGDRIDLNARYAETVGDRHVKEQLDVKGHHFTLHHLFVAPAGRRNAVHLCAHGRVVTARSLNELLDEVDAQQNVAAGGAISAITRTSPGITWTTSSTTSGPACGSRRRPCTTPPRCSSGATSTTPSSHVSGPIFTNTWKRFGGGRSRNSTTSRQASSLSSARSSTWPRSGSTAYRRSRRSGTSNWPCTRRRWTAARNLTTSSVS